MTKMKLFALQMDIQFEDPLANFRVLERSAKRVASEGADLLISPEMFSTGFSMNTALASRYSEATIDCVCECACQNGINIIAGYVKMIHHGTFGNAALVVNRKGEVIHEYLKTYLFSPLNEDNHYLAGNGTSPFELEGIRMAIGICYDIRFPELFRAVAPQVDAFVIPASWPASRQAHWDVLLRARAVENQAYVVGANRIGEGGELHFEGGSAVISPAGEMLASLYGESGLIRATIDTAEVTAVRTQYPFLKDMK